MILLFALSFCVGALLAASRLGRLPRASATVLSRVLRPIALVVLASVVFGALIGFASAKREASAAAWRQVREARQRLDPKTKANDPAYWQKQLAEGEAKLKATEGAGVAPEAFQKAIGRTASIALFLSGIIGGLALVRLRAEP